MILSQEAPTQSARALSSPTGVAVLSTLVAISCLSGTSSAVPYRPQPTGHVRQLVALAQEPSLSQVEKGFASSLLDSISPVSAFDEVRSDKDEVLWVKEASGLTWDQLGKVLGVSRRSVHLWATGGRMNEAHASRLREFSAAVRAIGAESADGARAALLDLGGDGISFVDQLRRRHIEHRSWGAPFTADELVRSQPAGESDDEGTFGA